QLLQQLNDERAIRRLGVTRRALFEELDRPNLNALPAEPYSFAEWRLRRVGVDYHVELEGHFYSVPYRFARSEVEVRLTPRAVEIFLKGERIAAHLRASGNHRHTTVPEHMPSSHRRYADWTVERIRREAASIGPATAALCELILERRPHPEQGFRACLGIVRLVRPFGVDRLEAAATGAIGIGTLTYGSVRSILDNKLDRQTPQPPPANRAPLLHREIRGRPQYPRTSLLTVRRSLLLTHPTLDQLGQLGLTGMAQAFAELEASGEAADLSHADWLGLLLDRELTHRRDKRLAARLRYARLRQQAAVEDVDYRAPRGLDRALFQKLVKGDWIEGHDNLILCGPTGGGKSWLACALGHKACRDNRSVLYQRVPKLFTELALARGDGRYARILRSLTGVQLLILDDWGLEPLDAGARRHLYEILEERYARRS